MDFLFILYWIALNNSTVSSLTFPKMNGDRKEKVKQKKQGGSAVGWTWLQEMQNSLNQ